MAFYYIQSATLIEMQGANATIEYVDINEDEDSTELMTETVPLRLVRPVPAKSEEPPAFKIGDVIDARLPDEDGFSSIWWVCTIRKYDPDRKRQFQVSRKEDGEKCWVPPSKVRASQTWCGGKKWVARGPEASGLNIHMLLFLCCFCCFDVERAETAKYS